MNDLADIPITAAFNTQDRLDAQSYLLLRIGDMVGALGSYKNPVRALPIARDLEGSTVFASRIQRENMTRELGTITRQIQRSCVETFEARQQFWHADDYGTSPLRAQQHLQALAASIPDDKLQKMRETLAASIGQLSRLRYGGRELSAEQKDALSLRETLEAITLLDREIARVQEVRADTMDLQQLKERASIYRYAVTSVGSDTTERNHVAHRYFNDGSLRPEPSLERIAMERNRQRAQIRRAMADDDDYHYTPEEQAPVNIDTPQFRDYARIVDPETTMAQDYDRQMQTISRRLLGEHYNPQLHDFRFLLSDEPEMNAFTIPRSKPPIIVLTRGLIEKATTIDQIAGVVGHEIGHILAYQWLGNHTNSKIEEGGADMIAVRGLIEAGYDPEGLQQLLRMTDQKSSYTDRIRRAILDVHPLSDNRDTAMEVQRIALARKGFKVDYPSSPVPESLRTVVNGMHFFYSADSPLSDSSLARYDTLTAQKKFALLQREMERIDRMSIDPELKREYARQLLHTVADLIPQKKVDRAPEMVHRFFDHFLDRSFMKDDPESTQLARELYAVCLRRLGEVDGEEPFSKTMDFLKKPYRAVPPIGWLRARESSIRGFLNARDIAEAEYHAPVVIKSQLPKNLDWLEKLISQPRVQLPTLTEAAEQLAAFNNPDAPRPKSPSRSTSKLSTAEAVFRSIFASDNPTAKRPIIPLLAHHGWLQEMPNENVLAAMRTILGGEYVPTSKQTMSIMQGEEWQMEPPQRPARVIYRENLPLHDYFDNFTHENGVITAVREPMKAVTLPPELEQLVELHRDYPQQLANERQYITQRETFERTLLEQGVHWELLPERTKEFLNIYREVVTPPLTLTPYSHPFAHALIQQLDTMEAQGKIDKTGRARLLSEISDMADLRAKSNYRLPGINIDHPYIHEERGLGYHLPSYGMQAVDAASRDLPRHDHFINEARIDPFRPLDGQPHHTAEVIADAMDMTNSDYFTRLALASNYQEFQNLQQRELSVGNLRRLLEIKEQFQRYQSEEFGERIRETLRQTDAQVARQLEAISQGRDTRALIDLYRELPVINHRKLESGLIDHILTAIEHEMPETRSAILEHLFSTNFTKDDQGIRFRDPTEPIYDLVLIQSDKAGIRMHFDPAVAQQRARLVKLVTAAITHGMGVDDGSVAYREQAKAAVTNFADRIPGYTLRNRIIASVADRLEAQTGLAGDLRDMYFRQSATDAIRKDRSIRLAEGIFEKAKENARGRALALEFLSKPPTQATAEALIHGVGGFSNDIKRNRVVNALQDAHAQIWDLPITARTTLLSELIFLPGTSAASTEHVTTRMMTRLFGPPTNEPFTANDLVSAAEMQQQFKDRQHALDQSDDDNIEAQKRNLRREIREFESNAKKPHPELPDTAEYHVVNSYLTAAGEQNVSERNLLLSALLSAENQRDLSKPRNVGEVLNVVLSEMGPAGSALKQAIDSDPRTPASIREAFANSKFADNLPLRWDIVDQVSASHLGDANHPDPIVHIGPVKGAGKFGVTLINTTRSGAQYADTMLRPRALRQATREFDIMQRGAQLLSEAMPDMAPVADMISEARHTAFVEADMALAAKQNQIARQTYDGVTTSITLGDGTKHQLTHRVAELVERGVDYKRVTVATGLDFKHLQDKPISVQRAAGYSLLTTHLSLRLAGMPVDRDRHGGNVKLDGDIITHFDDGRTDLRPPTREQKILLGQILGSTMQEVLHPPVGSTPDFAGAFTRHINDAASTATPEVKQYLSGLRAEMLALGDAFALVQSDPAKDHILGKILGTALHANSTDPVIREAFAEKVGKVADAKLQIAARVTNRGEGAVKVENVRTPDQLNLPHLTEQEAALTHPAEPILPHRLATQRHAIQSGAGNGIGVAMGAYGLWNKFNDKDGTFHEDMKSGDTVRQTAAVAGVFMDVANIGAGAVSTTVDAKTFQQAKVQTAAASAPAVTVNGTPSSATTAPTAPTAATSAPAQASTKVAPSAKATAPVAPAAPAAPATGAAQAPTTSATMQSPAPPSNAQAGGATSVASSAAAQQAEKAATETAQAAAKAAEQAAKTEKLLKAGRIAGKAAIPLAVVTGAVEASVGARAGDRERVASAIGGTAGGIIGGMLAGAATAAATGAIVGSAVPGIGTVVVGIVAGVGGGIAGAVVGEEGIKNWSWGINKIGNIIGSDDKFRDAMKQLDPETQKQFAGVKGTLSLDDVHAILKSGKMDSLSHVDTNKDGKLSGDELKQALQKARTVFLDNQLTMQLATLESKGLGKELGDKNGKLTLDEVKAALKEKGVDLAKLIQGDHLNAKALTEALAIAPTPTARLSREL
ncbi:MAG: M48 family metalloprotease [Rickettsiales bacterium]